MEKAQFDVFLSHNSADKPAIEALARRLEEAGVRCWLDKWNLIPGEPWQEAIEQALEQCSVCAVFWGPKGAGRWEDEEMRAAIERRIAEGREGGRPRFRVVPVLLPGARLDGGPRLPAFVSRLTWVDFKTGLDDPEAFQRLLAGIHGNAPGGSVGPARVERAAAAEPAEQKAEKRQLRPLLWALLAAGLLALGLLLWLLWRHLSFPATLDSALDRANAEIQRGDPRAALRTLEEIERRHLANPADPRPFLEKANAYQVLSQFDRQRDAAIQADALAERLQNHGYIAEALLLQGMAQAQLGNPKEALTAFERAGTICAGEECPLEQAEALSNIAILQLQQGDFETARRSFERALGLFEALGDHDREALQNNALGVIALEQGNLGEGAKRFEQAQREYAETGNRVGQGEAAGNLGLVESQQGDFKAAAENLDRALKLLKAAGARAKLSTPLVNSAAVLFERLDLDAARERLEESLKLARELADRGGEIDAQLGLGNLLLARGENAIAKPYLEEARKKSDELDERRYALDSRRDLADLAIEEDPRTAATQAQEVLKGLAADYPDDAIRTEEVLARALLAQGRGAEAKAAVERAFARLSPTSVQRTFVEVALTRARIDAAGGQPDRARQSLAEADRVVRGTSSLALDFELRLARTEIEALYGDRLKGLSELSALKKEATRTRYLRGVNRLERLTARYLPSTTLNPT